MNRSSVSLAKWIRDNATRRTWTICPDRDTGAYRSKPRKRNLFRRKPAQDPRLTRGATRTRPADNVPITRRRMADEARVKSRHVRMAGTGSPARGTRNTISKKWRAGAGSILETFGMVASMDPQSVLLAVQSASYLIMAASFVVSMVTTTRWLRRLSRQLDSVASTLTGSTRD